MRVLLDGYWWMSGPPSGRAVLRELVHAWSDAFPEDELHLVVPAPDAAAARAESPHLAFIETRLRLHPVINTVAIRSATRRYGPFDATLTQNFAAPVRNGGVYVHDVLFQSDPSWFTPVERLYLALIPFLARRAEIVFTSSRSERRRILERNPRLTNIVATGLGIPSGLVVDDEHLSADDTLEPGGFLLTVGRLNVRKNIGIAIEAATRTGWISPRRPLVVVGSADGRVESMSSTARDAVADGSVRFVGHVDDARLAWLYRRCRLMLFLSRGEGYGLPPIEAAANGAPVLAADLPVLHEVLGATASFADPTDAAAVTRAIAAELDGPWLPRRRSAPGDRPWAEVVTRIRAAYRSEAAA